MASHLSDDEKRLFAAIEQKNDDVALQLINSGNVRVNAADEHGTSALMQAAFKGNILLSKALLDAGADVNFNEHKEGYTALMFAALAGAADLCKILLEHGAKSYQTNRIGKTASELAAFCGQHHCVAVINNHLSMDDVEKIIAPNINRDEARVPLEYAPVIHDLARSYNVHPVKSTFFLLENIDLLKHRKQVLIIFEELFERQMKQKETNEVMAFKLHIILSTLREIYDFIDKAKANENMTSESDEQYLTKFIRSLLIADKEWHFCEKLEILIRRAVQRWPYHESQLFQTILRQMANTKFGDQPTAIDIVQQVVLGQRATMDSTFCSTCGDPHAKLKCTACKFAPYCSVRCQKLHWPIHKVWCAQLKDKMEQMKRKQKEEIENEKIKNT